MVNDLLTKDPAEYTKEDWNEIYLNPKRWASTLANQMGLHGSLHSIVRQVKVIAADNK